MGILEGLIAAVSPRWAYEREAWRQSYQVLRHYDAAGQGRISGHWAAINESAETTDRCSRDIIRARARDLERNSDILQSVILAYDRNVVGKGYTLRANTGDSTLDRRLEDLWRQWCEAKNCDVTGEQSFTELLRMAEERKKVDGGILFLFRHTANALYQYRNTLQVVEEGTINVLAKGAALPWFMAGDPATGRSIQVDYLNGMKTPSIRRSQPAGRLGYVWDIWMDWGVSAVDWRGIAKNPGVQ